MGAELAGRRSSLIYEVYASNDNARSAMECGGSTPPSHHAEGALS
jgi:hypothetical protein